MPRGKAGRIERGEGEGEGKAGFFEIGVRAWPGGLGPKGSGDLREGAGWKRTGAPPEQLVGSGVRPGAVQVRSRELTDWPYDGRVGGS